MRGRERAAGGRSDWIILAPLGSRGVRVSSSGDPDTGFASQGEAEALTFKKISAGSLALLADHSFGLKETGSVRTPFSRDRRSLGEGGSTRPNQKGHPQADGLFEMVGATGFEPATSSSRTKRATKLRYAPTTGGVLADFGADCKPKDSGRREGRAQPCSPRGKTCWRSSRYWVGGTPSTRTKTL